ncbi:hypothetical protein SCOR_17680 [Sulfidibacter corallicola]|uniref:Mur ligase central domain-containing protein n=1 Tax=Sulfidibacter corallicola TaxID=2818388 RepID=A0A8A4TX75_SULCO|nr:hypothetical protein [Sulfidibacter corallicola]QTD53714.1 hypothetical protein J3U87_14775 [Sulfidibacter corallicola]
MLSLSPELLPEPKPPLAIFERSREWASFRPTLNRVRAVLDALDEPHRKYPHILVGGTNGKGTTATNLAFNLPGRVGLFQSPHLVDIRERITIGGAWVSDTLWRRAEERVLEVVPDPELSYFEWLLVLAVEIFRMERVDWAVFEIGLGGRWDAANALDPCLSVITNVGLDHVAILGDTREAIASEKIEIARPDRPLVLPESVYRLDGVAQRLDEIGCVPRVLTGVNGYLGYRRLVDVSLDCLSITKSSQEWMSLPGRREVLVLEDKVYLDGAHNVDGWSSVLNWMRELGVGKIPILCNLSLGKNPREFMDIFDAIADSYHLWPIGFEKELPSQNWPEHVSRVDVAGVRGLLRRPVLVTGSLYLVGAFKRLLM